jgi:hypothetical protein
VVLRLHRADECASGRRNTCDLGERLPNQWGGLHYLCFVLAATFATFATAPAASAITATFATASAASAITATFATAPAAPAITPVIPALATLAPAGAAA